MGEVIPFPSPKNPRSGRSKAELAEAAQKAVEAGLSPMHPSLRNVVRPNVIQFKPKAK